jgi:hypothetical protein
VILILAPDRSLRMISAARRSCGAAKAKRRQAIRLTTKV